MLKVIRDLFVSVFWTTVVIILTITFSCVWVNYVLKKDFVVHMKGAVVISGTSSGIGHHATFAVAEYGYTIFACVRNEKSVQNLKEEAKTRGLEHLIIPIVVDVTNNTQIDLGVKEVTTFLSRTELPMVAVVNNAGFSGSVPIELESSDHIHSMFDVNFFGSVLLTQKFLHLIRRDQGRLIFVSSLAGYISIAGKSLYSATKRAIESIVDTLRIELEPFGVSVTSLVSGFIRTSIVQNSLSATKIDKTQKSYKEYFDKELKHMDYVMKLAPTPEATSNAIVDAIRNPFPETRYFMGTVGKFSSYYLYMRRWLLTDRVYEATS